MCALFSPKILQVGAVKGLNQPSTETAWSVLDSLRSRKMLRCIRKKHQPQFTSYVDPSFTMDPQRARSEWSLRVGDRARVRSSVGRQEHPRRVVHCSLARSFTPWSLGAGGVWCGICKWYQFVLPRDPSGQEVFGVEFVSGISLCFLLLLLLVLMS